MGIKKNSNEKKEKLFINLKGSEIPIDKVSIALAISSFTTFFIIILKVKGLFEYSGLIFLGGALLIYFLLTLLLVDVVRVFLTGLTDELRWTYQRLNDQ